MSTVINDLHSCPSGHIWCGEHDDAAAPGWHSYAETLTVGQRDIRCLFTLDERDNDPSVHFELYDENYSAARIEDLEFLDSLRTAVGARLTWFAGGVKAVEQFTRTVISGERDGDPNQHEWALVAPDGVHAHYINYDTEAGWRVWPWIPNDTMAPGQFEVWFAQATMLNTAAQFLMETYAEGAVV